jgi:hypothetical protein
MINTVVIVVQNGVVVEVVANSDTHYRVVDLDTRTYDEYEYQASLSQMESEEESEAFCRNRLGLEDDDEDLS